MSVVQPKETHAHEIISREDFRAVFSQHPGGVCVITAVDGTRPIGFTATSVVSVSAAPPILSFSINKTSSSWQALSSARRVAVHFLSSGDADLAARFATPGIDRFEGVAWTPQSDGTPILDQVGSWVIGSKYSITPVGSSELISVLIESSSVANEAPPLIYCDRRYFSLDGPLD